MSSRGWRGHPAGRAGGAAPARSRGFTLVELGVTVAVILVLLGLLLPVLTRVRRSAREAETRRTMLELGNAISAYLQAWPLLGDASADAGAFAARPLRHLIRNMADAGRIPFLEPRLRQLARTDGASATLATAEILLDGFAQPLRLVIRQGPFGAGDGQCEFADVVEIRSTMGTPGDPQDDLRLRFTLTGDVDPRDGARDPGAVVQEWLWLPRS